MPPRPPHCDAVDPTATIHDELAGYLRSQGLPEDSGVSLRWVWVRFLGIPLVFPNFDARRTVLFAHDVHHLLTGYDTTWRGEGEIGAFEIASGCGRFWAAWMFNLWGFLFGLVLAPRRTFRAFVRGCHARNFYGAPPDEVRRRTVGDARHELGLDLGHGASPADATRFIAWAVFVVALNATLLFGCAALVAAAIGAIH